MGVGTCPCCSGAGRWPNEMRSVVTSAAGEASIGFKGASYRFERFVGVLGKFADFRPEGLVNSQGGVESLSKDFKTGRGAELLDGLDTL